MKIEDWYCDNFESKLNGRYITNKHILPLLEDYKNLYEISVAGHSENEIPISLVKIGKGPKVVLGWSQMHGNEATTTKALFDLFKFMSQKDFFQEEIDTFLNNYTLFIIPILNPDGAKLYTRENKNQIDLNRDAQNLSQSESRTLRKIFDEVKPSLCLNMHDQRSIYGFVDGNAATVSFLSPAADKERTLTEARIIAMQHIAKINDVLQNYIPGQVGRYHDSYNPECVGDTFQQLGVPTILFEAGHFQQDYQREKTREFIFYSLLALFDIAFPKKDKNSYKEYFTIPENLKNYNDFILKNVSVREFSQPVSIAIQYVETFNKTKIELIPIIMDIGSLKNRYAYSEKDMEGTEILTNSHNNLTVGVDISEIFNKYEDLAIICKNNLLL